jgi:prevent-host-death family protein
METEKIISATEARIRFGELMRQAQAGPVVVERGGVAQVVVLSKSAYDDLVAAAQQMGWKHLLEEAHRRVRMDLGDRRLPPAEDFIRAGREERSEQVDRLR